MTTSTERIRVLIVDDSALMRKLLSDLIGSDPEIEIAGTARDGDEAIQLAGRLRPDVVTLDIAMPGRSGLETLPELLEVHKVPVVMVSTLAQEGADVTLAALELGAVDFMPKPNTNRISELLACRDLLVAKVRTAAQSHVHTARELSLSSPPTPVQPPVRTSADDPTRALRCVVLGISTGGPQALSRVLPGLRPPIPPLLIVQHMPAQFTPVFAARLNRLCSFHVKEASENDRVEPDQALIAPGGRHMRLVGRPPHVRVSLSDDPPVSGHRPSIDVLFQSAARTYGAATTGILMTGMGRDGVEGCRAILQAGGATFGQDERTSVVYGMNKAAYLEGCIEEQFRLDELPALVVRPPRR